MLAHSGRVVAESTASHTLPRVQAIPRRACPGWPLELQRKFTFHQGMKFCPQLVLITLSALSAILVPTEASSGDIAYGFRACVAHCQANACAPFITHPHHCHQAQACRSADQVPWVLRATGWDCTADCRYKCMLEVERDARLRAAPPQKYFGKWPFQRIMGMQEAASVLFSLLNLAAHLHNVCKLWRASYAFGAPAVSEGGTPPSKRKKQLRYPFLWWFVLLSICHMMSWASSAVFHTRDTKLTERIDYCAAILTIHLSFWVAVARATNIMRPWLLLANLLSYMWHIHHMLFVKFDYGWNVKVCVGLGMLNAAVWVAWALWKPRVGRAALLTFLILCHLALLLEVLDFPPLFRLTLPADEDLYILLEGSGLTYQQLHAGLGLVDAHALWHACTVPLTYLFYSFLLQDAAVWVHAKEA